MKHIVKSERREKKKKRHLKHQSGKGVFLLAKIMRDKSGK